MRFQHPTRAVCGNWSSPIEVKEPSNHFSIFSGLSACLSPDSQPKKSTKLTKLNYCVFHLIFIIQYTIKDLRNSILAFPRIMKMIDCKENLNLIQDRLKGNENCKEDSCWSAIIDRYEAVI